MSKTQYYLGSGFKEDCVKLLSLFDQTNSIRFENFCEVWKEMKFALIYAGRQTYSELLEYCEEIMHIAKQFALPPNSFKERIGGLYLLYGLYYKMPIKDSVKIRITQEQWLSLMELHEQFKAGEHLDANFILTTLIHDEAFGNTVFDFEWGLEKYYRQKQVPSNAFTILPSLLELTQEGHPLAEINNLSKKYRQTTSLMSNSSLKLFNENFVQDILNDVRRLEVNKLLVQSNVSIEAEGSKSDGKRLRKDSNKVRPKIGDGFDMDTSEEEEEVFEPLENYDPNLTETFEDEFDTETEMEIKRPKFAQVSLPNPKMKVENLDENSSD